MKTNPSLNRSLTTLLCAATATLLILSQPAQAGYAVTLEQVGSNVVATGSGAIDLTGLIFQGSGGFASFMNPSNGSILTGPATLISLDEYAGIHGPASFGTHSGTENASSGSGDLVGIINDQFLLVPSGYVSGPLSGSSTYDSATLSSLGVTPGIYEWTWGDGGADQNFTLQVQEVPEPATWLAGFLALITLFGANRLRFFRLA